MSHPARFVPGLTFGIQEDQAQKLVDELRDVKKVDLVVLLSHNGLSTDLKMAGRVNGIDVVLGGHTHDGIPEPIAVGRTLVMNSGAHGKFLSRLDLDVRAAGSRAPLQARARAVEAHRRGRGWRGSSARSARPTVGARRAPGRVGEPALPAGELQRQLRRDHPGRALKRFDAEVAFSPGFRWGVTIVPGQAITLEDVYAHTGLTYPNCSRAS